MTEQENADADWSAWEQALAEFSAASGLVVSAYDASGQRRLGPFLQSRLSTLLAGSTLWDAHGDGTRFEQALAMRAAAEGHAGALFCEELCVQAVPLTLFGKSYGAVVYGWVFNRFTSGMACERIARQLGMSGTPLWAQARLESPVPQGRMTIYTELLRTLIDSTTRQKEAIVRLNELNRMRDVFLATVSHEMRTPLSAISMRLEMLLRSQLNDPERLRRELGAMMRHVAQETRMVEDLIDAAQTRNGQLAIRPEHVSLIRIVRDALSTVEPGAQAKQVALGADLPAQGELMVWGDAQRLQQLFWNLLSNAVKFTPEGGMVRLRVLPGAQRHLIEVSDTGQGIAEQFLPEVFGAFNKQQSHNAGGLGLGLFIARHIVELHGGTIEVSSGGAGQGATFTVSLPALAGASA
ncbi:HAMP domain-containing histidine kinase|uniref:sensor histidine kinase n=1 Tax=Noviherbaspirillum sp. L7-7A TaxID=2850560 RepID=UPI001C2C99C0|nr:HAMP domain-containing sensor histidine kinase [Noviherbaspirillum sp. L7-7A]MBV0880467.1 HAMP domain-containing histidine kinase [Noviherbaspirillum sp. L7-7A]